MAQLKLISTRDDHVLDKLKKEWFLVGMLAMMVLAAFTPDLGRSDGLLHLDKVTSLGIGLIFFLHGLGLSPQAIKAGAGHWRLHLFIQIATFVAYPLLWVIFGDAFLAVLPQALAFGFCYLFALPGTISSSVAMTSIGKGNIAGAIFNASLSSILGIVVTPFFVQLFMGVEGGSLDFVDSIQSIAVMLLLPIILGQIARPYLFSFYQKHKAVINKLDKCIILLIVFNAFCDSFAQKIWSSFSWQDLVLSLVFCVLVLLVMVHAIVWCARRFGFSHQDEVAAVFCGSKKTLAAGVPMAKVIFGDNPHLGMILLPIMLYHPIQIFYCALLANRYAQKAAELEKANAPS